MDQIDLNKLIKTMGETSGEFKTFNAIMNTRFLDKFKRSFADGAWTQLGGIPIVFSDNVPEDQAYLVETNFTTRPVSMPAIEWDDRGYDDLLSGMRLRIQKEIDANFLYGFYGRPAPRVVIYDWTQRSGESVLQWGDRLVRDGVMDAPDVRWVYQVAVMGAPVRWLRKLFGR